MSCQLTQQHNNFCLKKIPLPWFEPGAAGFVRSNLADLGFKPLTFWSADFHSTIWAWEAWLLYRKKFKNSRCPWNRIVRLACLVKNQCSKHFQYTTKTFSTLATSRWHSGASRLQCITSLDVLPIELKAFRCATMLTITAFSRCYKEFLCRIWLYP